VAARSPNAWVQRTSSFIDLSIGVLAAPRTTFRALAAESSNDWSHIGMAGTVVVIAAALDGLRFAAESGRAAALAANVVLSIYMGLVLWLSIVSIPALLARFFALPRARVHAFAATSGWSFLPWLLMPALSLWESVLGTTAVLLFAVTLFVWIVYLFWIAVEESFSVSGKQTLCLLLILPQLAILVVFVWVWQIVNEVMSLLGA